MKTRYLLASAALVLASGSVMAQSAIDALQLTPSDMRGTARFMSMGGAFTALGGDLSTLTQNPAGIGVYRRSEIGATLDINIMKATTDNLTGNFKDTKTKVACNNFGYIGVANLSGTMQTFAWGATYNRIAQWDRVLSGYAPTSSGSLTNYIANYTSNAGYSPEDLNFGDAYNPYMDSDCDWLSILAYNSALINPEINNSNVYNGLYHNGTNADAALDVRERGYIDEYSINFGGNISNTVYWGLGIGITDMSYTRETTYSESMENAYAYNNAAGGMIGNADAGYYLDNYKHITGSGWKMSFGLIFRPVNEFRIGAAVHTPTWWSIDHSYGGSVDYSYYDPSLPNSSDNPTSGNEETDWASFNWKLKSPWRFMVGVAAVIGNNAIVSVDYERQAYNNMTVKNAVYDYYGYLDGYDQNNDVNNDIKTYTRASNILRVGIEYRPTAQLSLRAGYNYQTSDIATEAENGTTQIITSGTDPSYSFEKDTQRFSLGIGYRFGSWYIDGAYMYTTREGNLHAYTNWDGNIAPSFKTKQSNSSIVLSLGYKF